MIRPSQMPWYQYYFPCFFGHGNPADARAEREVEFNGGDFLLDMKYPSNYVKYVIPLFFLFFFLIFPFSLSFHFHCHSLRICTYLCLVCIQ